MAAPPLRTEISDTYPLPSDATARAGFGKLWDYVRGLLGATGDAPEARTALGATTVGSALFTAVDEAAARAAIGVALVPPVRQTVLSGPVDSSGFAAFGGSTGSATLTTSATLKATAAAGGDANYTGSIVNPAFTSPAGSGTGFLMLGITSAGVVTASVRTLPPLYQHGGTYSATNGQLTYNVQEGTMKAGNGASAAQVFEVCIGECPHAGGVWSGSPTWYALQGRYDSGLFAVTTSMPYSKNHNLGSIPKSVQVFVADDTAGLNERTMIGLYRVSTNEFGAYPSAAMTRTSLQYTTAGVGVSLDIAAGSLPSGAYRYVVGRGW